MVILQYVFFLFILFSHVIRLSAVSVNDIRFFPNFNMPRTHVVEQSFVFLSPFATTASSAYIQSDDAKSIFALFGNFDLHKLANAATLVGITNPLNPEFQGLFLPFFVDGTMQTQGATIAGELCLLSNFDYGALSCGGTVMVMQSNVAYNFRFNSRETTIPGVTPTDIASIEQSRKTLFELLRIYGDHASNVGFSDAIVYLRYFKNWDYSLKFRQIQAGLASGVLIPSGQQTTTLKPHAIAHGFEGHWGVQITADSILQIKETMKAGFEFEVSKRFKKTRIMRAPVDNEPYIFGALIAPIEIHPGATLRGSAYFLFEHLRDCLSLGLQYTLTSHIQDTWHDVRVDKTVPTTLMFPIKESSWASEYITLLGFYDFDSNVKNDYHPLVSTFSIRVDIPICFVYANNTPQSYRVSIDFGLHF